MRLAGLGDHVGRYAGRGTTVTRTGTAAGTGPMSSASDGAPRSLPGKRR